MIFLDASADLSGKTYVLGIVRGTQLVVRIFNGKRTMHMILTTGLRKLQVSIGDEIILIQHTERLLALMHLT